MSDLYGEREQYLKMKQGLKDSQKLRHKKVGVVLNKSLNVRLDEDQYLTIAKNQQRVNKAIKYDAYILGLYTSIGIFIGIVMAIVIYR